MKDKTCLVLVGPTAVGKTPVAIQLSKHYNAKIISADSRQCFKELNIGVAKPSEEDLSNIHHYFINSHTIHEDINAKLFEQYALQAADEIFKDNDVAIMVGGTGLYIKAFSEGLDEIPNIDVEIRKEIILKYEEQGIEWLQLEVKKHDANYFAKGEIQNPQRLMRSLEIKLSTGRSITDYQTTKKKIRSFQIIKIGLELPKAQLYENINIRVDKMMADGLLKEAEMLMPFKHLNALQTVGYKELFDHMEGKISLDGAIDKIKLNTRHYAKRQMTWFKKDKEIKWLDKEIEHTFQDIINFLDLRMPET